MEREPYEELYHNESHTSYEKDDQRSSYQNHPVQSFQIIKSDEVRIYQSTLAV